jgi:hypothetical protein
MLNRHSLLIRRMRYCVPGLARTLGNLGRLAPELIESYIGLRDVARDNSRRTSHAEGPAGLLG